MSESKYSLAVVTDTVQPVLEKVGGAVFDDEARIIPIKIIQAGRTLNNTIYSEERIQELNTLLNLEEIPEGIFRSKKMFIDHVKLGEGEAYSGRSLEEWAATIQKAWVSEKDPGALFGEAKITPHKDWVYKIAKEQPEELGVSIHISAVIEKTKDAGDGKPGTIIKQVIDVFSVDFVTEASAGGGVVISENIDTATQNRLIQRASEMANANQDKELSTILEGFMGKANTKEVEVVSDDGKITPFKVVANKEKKEQEARRMFWAFEDYMAELLFKEESQEIVVEERIKAAQDGVATLFTNVNNLLSDDSVEESKSIFQSLQKVFESQSNSIEPKKEPKEVDPALMCEAQEVVIKDLMEKNIINNNIN